MKISFNADDIHELRLILANRFNDMLPEEAEKVFKETVQQEIKAIAVAPLPPKRTIDTMIQIIADI